MKKIMCMLLCVIMVFASFGISAVISGADDILWGDANADGKVDTKDVLNLCRFTVDPINYAVKRQNADVNYDKKVNMKDVLLIRQYLARIITTLVPENYTTTLPDPTYAVNNTYTIDQLNNCMYICGRAVMSGTALKVDQTAGGLKFKANCEGDIKFNVTSNNGGYMDIIVDDNYENIYRVTLSNGSTTTEYKQLLSLPLGEHTFTLLKASEWVRNKYVLNSVTINGEIASTPPTQKETKIEFYGDSITMGYGNLCDGGTGKWNWPFADGCMTYASFCSYELDADFAVAAAGGHGVLGGYDNMTDVCDKFFDYSIVSEKTPWSRSDYNADFIVINYGTNDNSRDKDALDTVAFKAKCNTIVEGMHTDNPNAKIIWIIGMNYVSDTSPVVTSLKSVASEKDYVYFKKFSAHQSGGDSHPNVSEHKTFGHELAEYINEEFPKQ